MSLKNFTIIEKLGQGAYSVVYKVNRIEDNQIYALKKVKMGNLSDKQKENAVNEVRILASIRHPNVIGYKQVFLQENNTILCIVMQYCDDGDLFQKITQYQKEKIFFQQNYVWKIIIDIVKGLKALHQFKILHRDMKTANIFLTKSGEAKLGDMNVSKVAKKGLLYTQTGTPYYASPEVWDDKPYDNKSDIWSLGCVIYQMCTLKPPFRANDMEGLYKKVIKGQYSKISKSYTFQLHHLISMMLQVQASKRPTCEQILKLPMIKKRMGQNIQEVDQIMNGLMNTIRIPKKLNQLQQKLPKPNYTPLKMRKAQNSASANSLQNENNHENQNEELEGLPKIKKKLIDIVDKKSKKQFVSGLDLFEGKIHEQKSAKKKRNSQSIEKILEHRNQRIRMIYGQARKRKYNMNLKDRQMSQPSKIINLPSIVRPYY